MPLTPSEFRALTTYIEAAIELAVARADYNQATHDYSSRGYSYEQSQLREAEAAAYTEIVREGPQDQEE